MSRAEQAVLGELSRRERRHSGIAWGGRYSLATATALSARHVQRVLHQLVEKGLITVRDHSAGGRWATIYRVELGATFSGGLGASFVAPSSGGNVAPNEVEFFERNLLTTPLTPDCEENPGGGVGEPSTVSLDAMRRARAELEARGILAPRPGLEGRPAAHAAGDRQEAAG